MTVHIEDHYGPAVYKEVSKVEWITKEWYGPRETRIVIHTKSGRAVDRHLDDIVKITEDEPQN